jgi:hypothetical protein
MTTNLKRWLAQRIAGIDSVRTCAIDAGADVVVHSWHGVIVHVHLVKEPLKAKAIRRLVQEATRIGVGSLFVVDSRLLPPHSAKLVPDEWLLTLHQLSEERVYSYRADADGFRLGQTHFEPLGHTDEHRVHVGPDVVMGRLPFFRTWVKTGALKGDWLVATFGGDCFWRSADNTARTAYQNAQRHAQQRDREARQGAYQHHAVPPAESKLVGLFAQLGLEQGASYDDVKSAFRKLAREYHPDVSALPKDEAEARFKRLNEAYSAIKTAKGW